MILFVCLRMSNDYYKKVSPDVSKTVILHRKERKAQERKAFTV